MEPTLNQTMRKDFKIGKGLDFKGHIIPAPIDPGVFDIGATSFPIRNLYATGSITIGDAPSGPSGTIRWHDGDFEGYMG